MCFLISNNIFTFQELLTSIDKLEISTPFHLHPQNNTDGTFRFTKPCSVKIVGSHLIGTTLMPSVKVDVSIVMGNVSVLCVLI